MMNTPEHTAAAAAVNAVDELAGLRDLAIGLQALAATVSSAAQLGDGRNVAMAAEELLPLHVEFALLYRTWLARRTIGCPPFVPLGGPDSMSV
jgi:hypothetical protein